MVGIELNLDLKLWRSFWWRMRGENSSTEGDKVGTGVICVVDVKEHATDQ